MSPSLKEESTRLARSWMQHEPMWLRDYLVAGVEDPRLNVQSIVSRHFLICTMMGHAPDGLMEQEYRFAAAMEWLTNLAGNHPSEEEREAVVFALRHSADNAEGIEVPGWILRIFRSLPGVEQDLRIPNYVEEFLLGSGGIGDTRSEPRDVFCKLWQQALAEDKRSEKLKVSVVEPACGSANDYRFWEACGIARRIQYTGFDLCARNVENARAMFPGVRFEEGNVFEIAAPDKAFDVCVVHDLFEHLSFEGLETAIREICRIARQGICAGFFQMDEIPAHVLRPVEEYHWNLLSLRQVKRSFASYGFSAQVIHIGSFLRQKTGCPRTHNPHAYTLILHAV